MSTGIKAVKTALVANLFIFLMKLGAALLTRSASMMAEAVHSFADAGNQILLLIGYSRSQKPPDDAHPFGYGKEEYFWSFIVAMILFVLGSVYSLYEGVHKLMHPEPLRYVYLNFLILGTAVVLEGYSWWVAKKAVGGSSVKETLKAVIDSKDSNAVVVFVEDTGALVGLAVALAGNAAAYLTGNTLYDAVSSIIIGLLLLVIAYFLANEMRKLIIGETADASSIEKARMILLKHPHVKNISYMRSMHLGASSSIMAVCVDFVDSLHDHELEKTMASLIAEIKVAVPEAKDVFLQLSSKDSCLDHQGVRPSNGR